ncbi:MAG TPA: VWA domain-containing protein, partial [Dehalococcoidia bacterium]|nr:VWA domain-containing protein [Dehalococcoidia bacterium]
MDIYRYSQWDGSQELGPLDPDELLAQITDDLLSFGDLQHALRNLLQRGMRTPRGQRLPGLRDILQKLRQQRRQVLDRYNLSSAMDDLQRRLEEVVQMERDTLKQRQAEADFLSNQGEQEMARMLREMARRKEAALEGLPQDFAGKLSALQQYEFINPEAQHKLQELLETLRQAMLQGFFKDLYSQIAGLGPQEMQRLKEMMRDLNEMLSEKLAGGEPDFQSFMEKYGDLFGPNPPRSLEELLNQMQQQMAQMQSFLESLPPEMRQQLHDLLTSKIGDPGLQHELIELAINLDLLNPIQELRQHYLFRGGEEMDLLEGLGLMEHLQSIDEVEKQVERAQYSGTLDDIDADKLRDLLDDEAYRAFEQLRRLLEVLEKAGYIRRQGQTWELTPQGIRKIGQRALAEIYAQLRKSGSGRHLIHERGQGGDLDEQEVKVYEFGDPPHLNLGQTMMNALFREGPQVPLKLEQRDFAVYRTEDLTQTATVIMLDLSWSMALRGSFQAAKKVALALYNLIKTQYTRDALYIVGFSAYARELKPEELPYIRWDETVLGTNMHHALILAQQLLSRHKVGTRQVIMITDGEPTAHLEH